MPRSARPLAVALAAGLTLGPAAPAAADLKDDAERVAMAWRSQGAEVTRLDPLFLERGRARTVSLAPPSASAPAEDGGCLTVGLLGARTLDLTAALGATPVGEPPPPAPEPLLGLRPPEEDAPMHSAGGALVLSRCGAARAEMARISLDLVSPRGAVEILTARSPRPLTDIEAVLPERAAGPVAPRGDAGGPIEPGPLVERLARAERRARSDGALRSLRTSTRASNSGAGQLPIELGPGCHRIEVMAEVPAIVPRRITDVDAEARVEEGGRLLARDRADVPDARLDFCLGEVTMVNIVYAGASGATNVAVLRSEWPLSPSLPVRWGARARAGFASALRQRHAPDPRGLPVHETVGVSGSTQVPVEVEPGRCYLAAVALIRGEAKVIRFSAHVGDRTSRDALERPEGAAVAFCAEAERSALFEVDLRGGAPWWVLALWPLGAEQP
ncbi:MAG: hypothetical protein U0359_38515 [Byssovorax sp.]